MEERRNLLAVIEACLKEHTVNLKIDESSVPFYLIEGSINSGNLYKDFVDTYPEIDNFKNKLAKKVFRNSGKQDYGILVNPDLKYVYAFNRKFADLDKDKSRLVFSSAEEVLLSQTNVSDLSNSDILPLPTPPQRPPAHFPITVRYAIVGKKCSEISMPEKKDIDFNNAFGRPSLLDRIAAFYKDNYVAIKGMEKKELSLITTSYETKTIDDFIRTYEPELDGFKIKIAEKLFGKEKSKNNYGLVFDSDLTMIYAFNAKFGGYNPHTKEIAYKSVEDILLNDGRDFLNILPNMPRLIRIRRPGGATFKYACLGKK